MEMKVIKKRPEDLRSHQWFGVDDLRSFGHRSRIKQMGYSREDWAGKPVIGIINTWSEINSCHCLLYTSPSPRDVEESRMPSSA